MWPRFFLTGQHITRWTLMHLPVLSSRVVKVLFEDLLTYFRLENLTSFDQPGCFAEQHFDILMFAENVTLKCYPHP